jgi:ABC-type antimicrobial peptide transport system permease subunit
MARLINQRDQTPTLDDIRSEILSPNWVNALVFSGFASVALLIAVVGVAGVLALSVSARTREFGVRLAIGPTPRHLLTRVLSEGAVIGVIGIVAGAAGGWILARVAGTFVSGVQMPGVVPIAAAAGVLVAAAIIASVTPAARAARVDVISALRSEIDDTRYGPYVASGRPFIPTIGDRSDSALYSHRASARMD